MSIKELFLQALADDKPEQYLTGWELQDTQESRENQEINFRDFKGKEDLYKWMEWACWDDIPCYLPEELTKPLIQKSLENDLVVCKKTDIPLMELPIWRRRLGLNNAIDYIFPSMFKKDIKNVLDFGAGYGRQANLWSDGVYVGMDACLNSYCTQVVYYESLNKSMGDYISSPSSFNEAFRGYIHSDLKGIYHLPTWRYDLLPDNFFDLTICVQVLRELNETLVKKMLTEFHRVLRVGGIIYIRDHDTKWMPCGSMNIEEYILNLGFEKGTTTDKNFKPDAKDGIDLHGVVKVYKKI